MPSNSSEYQRKYYLANKDKLINQIKVNAQSETMCQLCNKMVKKSSMSAHKQTKLHKYVVEQNELRLIRVAEPKFVDTNTDRLKGIKSIKVLD